MVIIHVPIIVQTDGNLINNKFRMQKTHKLPARDVFEQTVSELFQWISGLLNIALPSRLIFALDVYSRLGRRMIVDQSDSNSLEAVKAIAWCNFREIASLDPAVAKVKILILPLFSAALGGVSENMQQQSQHLHSADTTSNILSDQPSYLPVPNQHGSGIESDSARCLSTTEPGGPPPFGPPPQTQSSSSRSLAPDTLNPYGGLLNSAPSSMPTPHNKNTLECIIPNSNKNMVEVTDEYSVQSRRGLCVKTGQLRVELIALKVV